MPPRGSTRSRPAADASSGDRRPRARDRSDLHPDQQPDPARERGRRRVHRQLPALRDAANRRLRRRGRRTRRRRALRRVGARHRRRHVRQLHLRGRQHAACGDHRGRDRLGLFVSSGGVVTARAVAGRGPRHGRWDLRSDLLGRSRRRRGRQFAPSASSAARIPWALPQRVGSDTALVLSGESAPDTGGGTLLGFHLRPLGQWRHRLPELRERGHRGQRHLRAAGLIESVALTGQTARDPPAHSTPARSSGTDDTGGIVSATLNGGTASIGLYRDEGGTATLSTWTPRRRRAAVPACSA